MTKQTARLWLNGLILLTIVTAACNTSNNQSNTGTNSGANTGGNTVTIYVSQDRVFAEPVLHAYEQKTGVKVNAVYDTEETKSTGLANKLIAEKIARKPMFSGQTSRCERWF